MSTTNQARRSELLKVSENVTAWTTIVRKEKAIYHIMNLFNYDINRKCLIAEGWCPSNDIALVQQALKEATVSLPFYFYIRILNYLFLGCLWYQSSLYFDRVTN